jgi:hypothetical protein
VLQCYQIVETSGTNAPVSEEQGLSDFQRPHENITGLPTRRNDGFSYGSEFARADWDNSS